MAKQLIPSVLGEAHPETTRACEISVVWDSNLFYEYEQLSATSWCIRRALFRPLLHLQLITTDFEGSLNVLEHFIPEKRLIHRGANGFKSRQCALISER